MKQPLWNLILSNWLQFPVYTNINAQFTVTLIGYNAQFTLTFHNEEPVF